MGFRSDVPTNIKQWQRDRLFVGKIRTRKKESIPMCMMGVAYHVDNVRGMLAIRVGLIIRTLNSVYEFIR